MVYKPTYNWGGPSCMQLVNFKILRYPIFRHPESWHFVMNLTVGSMDVHGRCWGFTSVAYNKKPPQLLAGVQYGTVETSVGSVKSALWAADTSGLFQYCWTTSRRLFASCN